MTAPLANRRRMRRKSLAVSRLSATKEGRYLQQHHLSLTQRERDLDELELVVKIVAQRGDRSESCDPTDGSVRARVCGTASANRSKGQCMVA